MTEYPSLPAANQGGPPDIDTIDVEAVNSREKRSLYQARIKVFPKRAYGFFRRLKWQIMAVTLTIYYVTPWLRWDRGPFAPDQAVLVDMANRRFYFFFLEIWPHEFFYVAGLLVMAGLGLFLVTTAVGRAWCGYACPQTVWVDLFIAVERWIEGDRNARIKLDQESWSAGKLLKRLLKNAVWLVIGIATGGAWIFYFADAPTLARDLAAFEAPMIAYITIAVLTATTFVFGGYMREQVCTYMCPWPRIQSAMLDEDSLVVTYNDWRGEPRGRHRRKQSDSGGLGDCVDCNQCVAVCPMGIDIRYGQQLECITCALCLDACDAVMEKTGKAKGLISYNTLKNYNQATAGTAPQTIDWRVVARPRIFIYLGLWSLVGVVMLYSVMTRALLEVNMLHDRNPLYVQLSDGTIRNGYTVRLLNKAKEPRQFTLSLTGLHGAKLTLAATDAVPGKPHSVFVAADAVKTVRVFVTADPRKLGFKRLDFQLRVEQNEGPERASYDAHFEMPHMTQGR